MIERLELKGDLINSIEHFPDEHFFLLYQPVVDLRTGEPVAAEALVRWRHPSRGVVSPIDFIPLAEETGLIKQLGRWVMGTAINQVGEASWDRWTGSVSVNVSPAQLREGNLAAEVEQFLSDSSVNPKRLTLEITESVLMDEVDVIAEQLTRLRQMGCSIAVDDFGTGYSSLGYLRKFPFDVLKIDRTFVTSLGQNSHDTELVRTIIDLAHRLNVRTVAEGISSPEELRILRDLGCQLGQGFLFAKPVTWLELVDMTFGREVATAIA